MIEKKENAQQKHLKKNAIKKRREVDFSRRALLQAGWMVPVVTSLPIRWGFAQSPGPHGDSYADHTDHGDSHGDLTYSDHRDGGHRDHQDAIFDYIDHTDQYFDHLDNGHRDHGDIIIHNDHQDASLIDFGHVDTHVDTGGPSHADAHTDTHSDG